MCRGTNTGGKTAGVKEIRVSGKCAKERGLSLLKVLTRQKATASFFKVLVHLSGIIMTLRT